MYYYLTVSLSIQKAFKMKNSKNVFGELGNFNKKLQNILKPTIDRGCEFAPLTLAIILTNPF
jgi:hypothetical protein